MFSDKTDIVADSDESHDLDESNEFPMLPVIGKFETAFYAQDSLSFGYGIHILCLIKKHMI